MRPIDGDEVVKTFERLETSAYEKGEKAGKIFTLILDLVKSYETVDPVKHGHWKYGNFDVRCSVCGEDLIEAFDIYCEDYAFKYCPFCGAKMDEETR